MIDALNIFMFRENSTAENAFKITHRARNAYCIFNRSVPTILFLVVYLNFNVYFLYIYFTYFRTRSEYERLDTVWRFCMDNVDKSELDNIEFIL